MLQYVYCENNILSRCLNARISKVLCASEVASAIRTWQYGAESEDDQSQTLMGLAY